MKNFMALIDSEMLNQLLQTQEELKTSLPEGRYSFIGPKKDALMSEFIEAVAKFAPMGFHGHSVNKSLANEEAVQQALRLMPKGMELELYLVDTAHPYPLLHRRTAATYMAEQEGCPA
jgi:hypothetical protein